METKNYDDEPKLNDEVLNNLARAYAVAFDVASKSVEGQTVESLLAQILSEIKIIRENQEKQRKIRLS